MRTTAALLISVLALAQPASGAPSPGPRPAPPAPALQAGGLVTDVTGRAVGRIEGVGEDAAGAMFVIVAVDGRLISIPEARLRWNGRDAVADRTRAQLLVTPPGRGGPARRP